MRRKTTRVAAFVLVALGTAFTFVSAAQTKKPASARPPTTVPAKKPPPKPEKDEDGGLAALSAKEERTTAGARDAGSVGVVESKQFGDGGKSYRFEAVEVEGRLKSPQLVYFLRRVRAEFAAGDLGHRTFLRELDESRNEPGL